MDTILSWLIKSLIVKEIVEEKVKTLTTNGSTNFIEQYTKAIKAAKADMLVVFASTAVCLAVVWHSLSGTTVYRVIYCIVLAILMNYINVIIVRSDIKEQILGYVKKLEKLEQIDFCKHFSIASTYDKHSGQGYYKLFKFKIQQESLDSTEEQAVNKEQAVNEEQAVNKEHKDEQSKENNEAVDKIETTNNEKDSTKIDSECHESNQNESVKNHDGQLDNLKVDIEEVTSDTKDN